MRSLSISALAAVLIAFGSATASAQDVVRLPMHGFAIGPYFEYVCPTEPNQSYGMASRGLLRGVSGYGGVWVDSLHVLCFQIYEFQNSSGSGSLVPVRHTKVTDSTVGAVFGNRQRPTNKNGACQGTQRIVGVRTNNYFHESTIAWIQPVCSEEASAGPDLERRRQHRPTSPLAGGGEKGPDDWEFCPLNTVAVGVRGHADHSIRMFGLICAAPAFAYKTTAPPPPTATAPPTLGKRKRPEPSPVTTPGSVGAANPTSDATTAGRTLGKRRRPTPDRPSPGDTANPAPDPQSAPAFALTVDGRMLRYRVPVDEDGVLEGPAAIGIPPGPYVGLLSVAPFGVFAYTADATLRVVQGGAVAAASSLFDQFLVRFRERLAGFRHIVGTENGVVYGVMPDGTVHWLRARLVDITVVPRIATGWPPLRRAFSGGGGTIYGIADDGQLWLFRHLTPAEATAAWAPPVAVAAGWQDYVLAFSPGGGVLYAVDGSGVLWRFRNNGHAQGEGGLDDPEKVGEGWLGLREVAVFGR